MVQEWASQRGETVVGSGAAAALGKLRRKLPPRNCRPSRTRVCACLLGSPAKSVRWWHLPEFRRLGLIDRQVLLRNEADFSSIQAGGCVKRSWLNF